MTAATKPLAERRHDIDAIRVLALGLLMLYHVGMYFVTWDWHVKSATPVPGLEPLMTLVNQWRMPLLFTVSGLSVHFLLARVGPDRFAWLRVRRLLLPLVFGMLVIVPPQAYVEALANDAFAGGYGAFLGRYFTFAPWPDGAFAGSDNGLTWNHLWYLPYLLFYTLVLIPLRHALNRLRAYAVRLRGLALVLVPVLPLVAAGHWVFPHFPYINHALIDDFYAHAMYGLFFVYGYLIGRDPPLWTALVRARWAWLGLAVAAFVALMGARAIAPDDLSTTQSLAYMLVLYINRWAWILTVLAWGHRWLNRPSRWLAYANDAVFPWYVLHQSITVIVGYALLQRALPVAAEAVILVTTTFGGCWLAYEVLIRRARWLRPLFGLKPLQGKHRADTRPGRPAAGDAATKPT